MTATPMAEVGDILLAGAYRKEEGDVPMGFAGIFGQIAGSISSVTATNRWNWR